MSTFSSLSIGRYGLGTVEHKKLLGPKMSKRPDIQHHIHLHTPSKKPGQLNWYTSTQQTLCLREEWGEEERRGEGKEGGRKRGDGGIEGEEGEKGEGGDERREEGGLAHLLPSKDVLVEIELQLFIGNVDTQLLK